MIAHKNKKKVFSLANLLIILGLIFLTLSFGPFLVSEVWFFLKELKSQEYSLEVEGGREDSVFARFLSKDPVKLDPVNTNFALVIEKIGINAPIVANVSVSDESVYKNALKDGIAHAISSDYPTKVPSNVFLFAHASLNFWEFGKYSTVFNLLRKLNYTDKIHIFYNGKDFVYEVANKEVVKGWNTNPITRPTIEPILTLQTCDPPGTTLNRYVVTAKLISVTE